MKILYVLSTIHHPTMRGALRHFHLLRGLAQRHSITVLALSRYEITWAALADLATRVEQVQVINMLPGSCAFDPAQRRACSFLPRGLRKQMRLRAALKKMREAFLTLTRQQRFDAVLFHGRDVYPVIEGFREAPIVADICDATHLRMAQSLRQAAPWEWPGRILRYSRVRSTEKKLVAHTPHLCFISPRDRDAVISPGCRAAIIPNGIDLAFWTPANRNAIPHRIVFTGVMDYPPNADAALYLIQRVLPLIRRRVSHLNLQIVGWNPRPALLAAAARCGDVQVTGYVQDIRPFLEHATVFAAPIRLAAGTQNKVLEALAMGVPVVTTSVVAQGLRPTDGSEAPVAIADDPRSFASSVARLLRSPRECQSMALRGRDFVARHFDWERSAALLEKLCFQAVAGAAVPTPAPQAELSPELTLVPQSVDPRRSL